MSDKERIERLERIAASLFLLVMGRVDAGATPNWRVLEMADELLPEWRVLLQRV